MARSELVHQELKTKSMASLERFQHIFLILAGTNVPTFSGFELIGHNG